MLEVTSGMTLAWSQEKQMNVREKPTIIIEKYISSHRRNGSNKEGGGYSGNVRWKQETGNWSPDEW